MTITRRSFLLSSAAVVAGAALPAMSLPSETFGHTTALMVTSRKTGARMALMVDPGETVDYAFLTSHGLDVTGKQQAVVPYRDWIGMP